MKITSTLAHRYANMYAYVQTDRQTHADTDAGTATAAATATDTDTPDHRAHETHTGTRTHKYAPSRTLAWCAAGRRVRHMDLSVFGLLMSVCSLYTKFCWWCYTDVMCV